MNLLHIMLRVKEIDKTISFFNILNFFEIRRFDENQGRYTLVFLRNRSSPIEIELTYNWDQTESYSNGSNFGHIAIGVEDIYETCQSLIQAGATLAVPPRDGSMAFVKTPDGVSIELLQMNHRKPITEPWTTMENIGTW